MSIKDQVISNTEIYNVRVTHESRSDNLIDVMPYLAKAAFTDFPGLNGQIKTIKIKEK